MQPLQQPLQHLTRVGLVAEESTGLTVEDLTPVAAAIEKQVKENFAPVWHRDAKVEAFGELKDAIQPGYWPLIISKTVGVPTKGKSYHLSSGGRPHAVVEYGDGTDWTVKASHECLEMLANPSGDRFITGQSLEVGQGDVQYLVEVCDPCQHNSYKMDSSEVYVSDFVTPDFYNAAPVQGAHYTFRSPETQPPKQLSDPLRIMPDCQLRWYDPRKGEWWQAVRVGEAPMTWSSLGPADPVVTPREAIALIALSAAAQKSASVVGRPEFYHLVYRLANDQDFHARFQITGETKKVYQEYGMDIPDQFLLGPVTLPSQEELRKALDLLGSSFGISSGSNSGPPFFSSCSFVP